MLLNQVCSSSRLEAESRGYRRRTDLAISFYQECGFENSIRHDVKLQRQRDWRNPGIITISH